MAKIHDLFIVELAEVIKGYGNKPDDEDPFRLSEFYRFYELPNIAVSRENFEKMRPIAAEIIHCGDCKHKPSGDGVNHNITFPDEVCPCQCEDYWYSWIPDDDFYCGNAERREE